MPHLRRSKNLADNAVEHAGLKVGMKTTAKLLTSRLTIKLVLILTLAIPKTLFAQGILDAVFAKTSYLRQFGNYVLSQSNQWLPNPSPPVSNAHFLYIGPNFQFQAVPQPTTFELLILGVGVCGIWLFRRRAISNSFHDRKTL
jgi:hypothetical protein